MHDIIFVPEEDPEGYLLFYPDHVPLKGQQVTLESETQTRTYEVVKVSHHWKRIVTLVKGDNHKVHDDQNYTTVVYGELIRVEDIEQDTDEEE